jgi:hypothetical protein
MPKADSKPTTSNRAKRINKRIRSETDPAAAAFERWQRASRSLDLTYRRREVAEEKLWKNRAEIMPPACCIFPDDQRDAARQQYEQRYNEARRQCGLAAFDTAFELAYNEYWAATAALAKSKATTLEGAKAKAKWLARNIPSGTTDYDGPMVISLAADLNRLVA